MKVKKLLKLLGDSEVEILVRTLENGNFMLHAVTANEVEDEPILSAKVIAVNPRVDSNGNPSIFIESKVEE